VHLYDVADDGEPQAMAGDRLVQPAAALGQGRGGLLRDAWPIVVDVEVQAVTGAEPQAHAPRRPLGGVVNQVADQLQHVLLIEAEPRRGVDLGGDGEVALRV
jgi:hypothetical protein